ncbi:MAG: hypothetical protein A3F78_13525 [Burkholderiales bacterium RIFCSPLOWO2_12_FULL_61_40]|nr:MAG: hypothetical protein A3F78_13525 [Burkholderiales bacterium RIFCSPLOWO2_12_FULL_61_40]
MKSFKLSAVAALLASFTFAASAMTPVNDEALSQVSGQDGVSIVADLQVNIGSFTYTDSTNTFAMNDIGISGVIAATIDVLDAATFKGVPTPTSAPSGLAASLLASGVTAGNLEQVMHDAATALGYQDQDVIAIAIPKVDNTTGLDITVASMTTGRGAAGTTNSMGGISLANLNLGGTKVWMFGHD